MDAVAARRAAVLVKPAVIVVAAALALAPAAAASSMTGPEVRELAARAVSDPAALALLQGVDRVDGRPVDIREALAGAQGEELRARLEVLASGGAVATQPHDPAADAREILSGRRFHTTSVPRPFQGALHWLGDKLRRLKRPYDWLAEHVPGGGHALSVILGALLVAAAAIAVVRVVRRRSAATIARSQRERHPDEIDPAQLEREADDAERRGDLERAVRLRFRAGLLRLARAKAIPPERSLTSGDVRRALHVDAFDGVATSFDEVVYGRRPPTAADVAASREGWRSVLQEADRS